MLYVAEMILLLVVLSFLPLSFAASCGGSGIPFRFEVLPSGIPILGCGSPQCFGVENGGRDILHDAKFQVKYFVMADKLDSILSQILKKLKHRMDLAYELVIVRMNCLPDPTEGLNDVSLDSSNDITRILDKVADTQGDVAQGADTYVHPPQQQPPQQNEEIVGEQVVPVTSGGYYYPVASGVPACFTGDTTIEMPSGKKRMDELKIGDLILTAEGNNTVFTPVLSFMHRLPDTVAFFIRVETEQSVLKLTPQHFIYKVAILYIHSVRISSVSVVQERGVYAPMTKAGDLLANNIYASCHNVIKSSTLTHTFLDFASNTQKKSGRGLVRDSICVHVISQKKRWMFRALAGLLLCGVTLATKPAINGTQCSKNQVITRLTVFEDGALEAECGPIPCGEAGRRCIADQTSCRADTDIFSGMKWAANGQSVLLHCCTIKVPSKIYVGTDLVTAGSYYEGGQIEDKDKYEKESKGSKEYDFIANIRTEQGGVRIWVYRVLCGADDERVDFEPMTTTPTAPKVSSQIQDEEEEDDDEDEDEEESEKDNTAEKQEQATKKVIQQNTFNPLRYRPPHLLRSSTGFKNA
uniref:HintN domain-containing protein n=1 Tax=Heterorhabditis bacteriophora TaxID=37862 RepID=A0A1I7WXK1_HETBA